jgi:hypothetical protein
MVTMDDGQASKKTSHGQVDCGDDEAISPLRKSSRYMHREAMTGHQYCLQGFGKAVRYMMPSK